MIFTLDHEFTKLCKRTVKAWGVETQLRLLQEECGECVAAINRFARGRDETRSQLAGEVADVIISALQVYTILGGLQVYNEINNKLVRLRSKLDLHDKNVILERETDYNTDLINDGG